MTSHQKSLIDRIHDLMSEALRARNYLDRAAEFVSSEDADALAEAAAEAKRVADMLSATVEGMREDLDNGLYRITHDPSDGMAPLTVIRREDEAKAICPNVSHAVDLLKSDDAMHSVDLYGGITVERIR